MQSNQNESFEMFLQVAYFASAAEKCEFMRGHVEDYCGDCGLATPCLSHSHLQRHQSIFRPVKYIQYFIQHKLKCYARMFPVHHLLLMPSELRNACLYTVMTSSNGMLGCIGRSHSPAHLAIMLNCLVAHCTAHCMLDGSVGLAVFIYFHLQLYKAAVKNQ